MALLHSFESDGNWLFKRRGWLPVFLFVLAVPVIFITDYSKITDTTKLYIGAIAVAVSFIGQWIRAYTVGTTPKGTSGRNTEEQVAESLNSTGIYSVVRHPLYLGNYLMWIGIVIYTLNWYFVIIISLMYWLYYERIMFAEERFLEGKFGKAYMDWSLKAPAFLPRFGQFVKASVPFSMTTVLRREYTGVLNTVIGFLFVDVLRYYATNGEFKFFVWQGYVLGGTIILVLILRTLKKASKLNEEGRS
ncbi:MAG: isoprenylcysteine carboxylmethyltransferase family protein [Bacteroidia bacterium]